MENKPKSVVNNFWLGFILGIIVPILTLIFINAETNRYLSLMAFLEKLQTMSKLSSLVSLCALANLAVFFLFIWKENYKTVKGVMLATVLLVFLVFVLKFAL